MEYEFYFPKSKSKHICAPQTGKVYPSKGGTIRYGVQATMNGSKSLPKYITEEEFNRLGFGAETFEASVDLGEKRISSRKDYDIDNDYEYEDLEIGNVDLLDYEDDLDSNLEGEITDAIRESVDDNLPLSDGDTGGGYIDVNTELEITVPVSGQVKYDWTSNENHHDEHTNDEWYAETEYPEEFLDEFYDFDSNPTADTQDEETIALAYATWLYNKENQEEYCPLCDESYEEEDEDGNPLCECLCSFCSDAKPTTTVRGEWVCKNCKKQHDEEPEDWMGAENISKDMTFNIDIEDAEIWNEDELRERGYTEDEIESIREKIAENLDEWEILEDIKDNHLDSIGGGTLNKQLDVYLPNRDRMVEDVEADIEYIVDAGGWSAETVGSPSPSSPLEEVPATVPSPAEPTNENFEAESKNRKMVLGITALGIGLAFWKGKELLSLWDSIKEKME